MKDKLRIQFIVTCLVLHARRQSLKPVDSELYVQTRNHQCLPSNRSAQGVGAQIHAGSSDKLQISLILLVLFVN